MVVRTNRPDDENPSVYDDSSGSAPSTPQPDLKAMEGRVATSPKTESDKVADGKAPSQQDLSEAENNPNEEEPVHENQVGRGYNPTPSTRGRQFGLWARTSRRRKWAFGVGGGVVGAGIIAFFLLFLPALRLESYLAGINQRVFAAANNAVSKRVENLFENYLTSRILTIQKCGNVVTSSCKTDYSKAGLAKSLFNTWQDARLENTLFEKYGFEVQSLKKPVNGQRFKIVAIDDRFGNPGDELTLKDGKLVLGKFEGGPRIFGEEWGKFISDNTRWPDILQRVSLRKYLVRKHGVKFWCFFACSQKDAIDNAAISATTKLKLKLIERIIYPFSTKYGLILDCITKGDASLCDPQKLDELELDRSLLSDQDLADLQKFKESPNFTLTQFLIEKFLVKAGVDEVTAHSLVSGIPLAGQIYLGLSAVDTLEQAKNFILSGKMSQIAAQITAAQYVEFYAAMRSADDEIKSGNLPADDVGALVSQFGYNNQPAEQSLVYQAYNNLKPATTASADSLLSLVAPKALADTVQSPQYLCDNGQPIPAGMLVCPEKTLNQRAFKIENYFKDSKDIINLLDPYEKCYFGTEILGGRCLGIRPSTDVHEGLKNLNWIINNSASLLLTPILSILKTIPGLNTLISLLTTEVAKVINALFQQVFPLPVQPDSPGRDRFDGLEAGGEITASEFNKGGVTDTGSVYGLGGQQLTEQQNADSSLAYLGQQDYDFSHDNIFSRATNISNPNSLISRFVAAMPTSWSQFSSDIFGFISRPFNSMGSIWHPAYAANNTYTINAFGVPRFGYTANDSVFDADPSIYTPEYCQQLEQKWEASKTIDPLTGIDEYSKTNPCLLERVSVEAASSVFSQNESLNQ